MRRPKLDIARAVLRLATEEQISIEDLARELNLTKENVRRWGINGKRGVYLDMARRKGGIWYTSRQALKRFQEAVSGQAHQAHQNARDGCDKPGPEQAH